MDYATANKVFENFTDEQKQFIKDKKMTGDMSVRHWLQFLKPICEFDQSCDKVRSKFDPRILSYISFCFISLFFVSVLIPMGGPILGGVFLVLAIRAIRTRSKFKSMDLNNNVRTVLYPMIHLLSLEVGLKNHVKIALNFNKELKQDDVVSASKNRAFSKKQEVNFQYDLIDLNCQFIDGTKLSWKVVDRIRKRRKTNPRGKVKIKYKLKRRILCQLEFDRNLYQLTSDINELPKEEGTFKQTESKIKFKTMLKESRQGVYAKLNLPKLLESVQTPYRHMTCIGESNETL